MFGAYSGVGGAWALRMDRLPTSRVARLRFAVNAVISGVQDRGVKIETVAVCVQDKTDHVRLICLVLLLFGWLVE